MPDPPDFKVKGTTHTLGSWSSVSSTSQPWPPLVTFLIFKIHQTTSSEQGFTLFYFTYTQYLWVSAEGKGHALCVWIRSDRCDKTSITDEDEKGLVLYNSPFAFLQDRYRQRKKIKSCQRYWSEKITSKKHNITSLSCGHVIIGLYLWLAAIVHELITNLIFMCRLKE